MTEVLAHGTAEPTLRARGPEALFTGAQVIALVATLRRIRASAEAS